MIRFRKKIAFILAILLILQPASANTSYASLQHAGKTIFSIVDTSTNGLLSPSESLTPYLDFSSVATFSIAAKKKTWNGELYYTDTLNSDSWSTWNADSNKVIKSSAKQDPVDKLYHLYIRGSGNDIITGMQTNVNWSIDAVSDVSCSGNINSLLDFDEEHDMGDGCFAQLFKDCKKLVKAPSLPSKNLSQACYFGLFSGCSNLLQVPSLPAEDAQYYCYFNMFNGCSSLTEAPSIQITTLAEGCFSCMFQDCTSLTKVPSLPSETLFPSCYASMFKGCINLETMPDLPATQAAESCYLSMFSGCANLTSIGDLSLESVAESCCSHMFEDCQKLSKAPELLSEEMAIDCYSYMFVNCESLIEPPSLPATVLASACYMGMFQNTGIELIPYDENKLTWSIPAEAIDTAPDDSWKNNMFLDTKTEPTLLNDDFLTEGHTQYSVENICRVITWDSGEGFYEDSTTSKTEVVPYGTLPENCLPDPLPVKESSLKYALTDWINSNPLSSKTYSDPITEDIEFIAQYEEILYTVNISSNDDTFGKVTPASPIYVPYESDVEILGSTIRINNNEFTATPEPASEKTLYKFDFWSGAPFVITEDTSITAVFSSSPLYKASVTVNDPALGSVDISEVLAEDGSDVSASHNQLIIGPTTVTATPVDTAEYSSSFVRWNNVPVKLTADCSITAEFVKTVKSYTVTFNVNGHGTAPTDRTLQVGSVISKPADPADAGYQFGGWFTTQTCDAGTEWNFDTEKMPANNLVLYAKWTAIIYTVTFETNGHGTAPGPQQLKIGDSISKPADPAETGYTFTGWYTTQVSQPGTLWNFDTQKMPASNLTLYAGWTLNSYRVTFDANGHGTAPEALTVTYGNKITKPADPSASGYRFDGWFRDSACTSANKWDFDVNTMPASDLTLYASWSSTGSGGGGSGGGGSGGGGSGGGSSASVKVSKTVPTFSPFWVADPKGIWRCFNPKIGDYVKSAWLCDDAIASNGTNVWYLMNTDGTMLAANLVRDNTGNYYSLETSHYGYFGSLRYVNGTYDGIYMEFSQKHDGTFGAITNKAAIDALIAKYGVTQFPIGNENSVYTSSFTK